ncbi:unnamed protein product [Peniophora sp. CBMAI 1063]|nr:unnamed protein product [Peniophora sp. CBMAI 1063]
MFCELSSNSYTMVTGQEMEYVEETVHKDALLSSGPDVLELDERLWSQLDYAEDERVIVRSDSSSVQELPWDDDFRITNEQEGCYPWHTLFQPKSGASQDWQHESADKELDELMHNTMDPVVFSTTSGPCPSLPMVLSCVSFFTFICT